MEGLTFWAPDGETVLKYEEVKKEGRWVEEGEKGLKDPKVLLKQLQEENARWAAMQKEGVGGGGGKRR